MVWPLGQSVLVKSSIVTDEQFYCNKARVTVVCDFSGNAF